MKKKSPSILFEGDFFYKTIEPKRPLINEIKKCGLK